MTDEFVHLQTCLGSAGLSSFNFASPGPAECVRSNPAGRLFSLGGHVDGLGITAHSWFFGFGIIGNNKRVAHFQGGESTQSPEQQKASNPHLAQV